MTVGRSRHVCVGVLYTYIYMCVYIAARATYGLYMGRGDEEGDVDAVAGASEDTPPAADHLAKLSLKRFVIKIYIYLFIYIRRVSPTRLYDSTAHHGNRLISSVCTILIYTPS